MDERFIKDLISTMKCGVCGRRYETANVDILGHRDDLWFLSVFCPQCHTQGLMAATIKKCKASEIVTDLTDEEYLRFANNPPVEADEVLEMYEFLENFKGNISTLLPRE